MINAGTIRTERPIQLENYKRADFLYKYHLTYKIREDIIYNFINYELSKVKLFALSKQ